MKINSIPPSMVKRNTLKTTLVDKLNDAINASGLENSQQYFLKDDFNKTFNTTDCKGTNFFHTNISSLTYNFDQLHTVLSEISINSDLTGITKCRLKNDRTRTTNIYIKCYTFERTPTEAFCGETLLYIKETLKCIYRKDLQIYKAAELESTFIELLPSSRKNQECAHPSLTVFI